MSRYRRNGTNGTKEKERNDPPVWSQKAWTGSGHVEVAVWPRVVSDREVLNATIRKTYKDGEEYKESKSLRPEELPIVSALLLEAFSFITNEENRK